MGTYRPNKVLPVLWKGVEELMIIVISIIVYFCIGVMIGVFTTESGGYREVDSIVFAALFWPVFILIWLFTIVTTPVYVIANFIKYQYRYRKSGGRGKCKYCRNTLTRYWGYCVICKNTANNPYLLNGKSWFVTFLRENLRTYWTMFK